jgi:hAT family C-terminal dimerisation region
MNDYLSSSSDIYLKSHKPSDVIRWWYLQQYQWPILVRLAVEIFSIPVMSDNIERVFSEARCMISWDRSKLGLDTVEAVECLASWFPYQFEEYFQDSQEKNQEDEDTEEEI